MAGFEIFTKLIDVAPKIRPSENNGSHFLNWSTILVMLFIESCCIQIFFSNLYPILTLSEIVINYPIQIFVFVLITFYILMLISPRDIDTKLIIYKKGLCIEEQRRELYFNLFQNFAIINFFILTSLLGILIGIGLSSIKQLGLTNALTLFIFIFIFCFLYLFFGFVRLFQDKFNILFVNLKKMILPLVIITLITAFVTYSILPTYSLISTTTEQYYIENVKNYINRESSDIVFTEYSAITFKAKPSLLDKKSVINIGIDNKGYNFLDIYTQKIKNDTPLLVPKQLTKVKANYVIVSLEKNDTYNDNSHFIVKTTSQTSKINNNFTVSRKKFDCIKDYCHVELMINNTLNQKVVLKDVSFFQINDIPGYNYCNITSLFVKDNHGKNSSIDCNDEKKDCRCGTFYFNVYYNTFNKRVFGVYNLQIDNNTIGYVNASLQCYSI
ncbi:MAG: hypothetical protein V1859_02515 [archaeon]